MPTATYFIELHGKTLWIATMPRGSQDRAFANRVAASMPGASVVSV